jgi:hypothetical protein
MKVTYRLDIKELLQGVPISERESAKEEIANTLIESILGDMNEGRSSVSGQKWGRLSDGYAKKMKGGDRLSDMYLKGDMQEALSYKISGNKIEFGWFGGEQAKKADGHNNFSGESQLPLRQSIPQEDEEVRPGIIRRLKDVVKEYYNEESNNLDSDQ